MNILNVVQSAGVVENILSGIQSGWNWVLLTIDSVLYRAVSWFCDIFFALAKLDIFDNVDYKGVVNRIYIILGLVMMFILAYTLLQAVINPDNFAKGENSFGKIAMNVVVSLVIIVILPTVFSLAYNIQNSLLEYQVVEKIIVGFNDDGSVQEDMDGDELGRQAAYYVMTAFFHPDMANCSDTNGGSLNTSTCAAEIYSNDESTSLQAATESFLSGNATFNIFSQFSEAVTDGEIDYSPLLSFIAAIAVAYVFLSFCFDMAVRVVKLMYFEIIAPIPVVCRVIPGGNMKSVFNEWVKKTISTYLEVFIRLLVVYLCLYLVDMLQGNGGLFTLFRGSGLGVVQSVLATAIVIMGIFIFMRQAPKMIGEMFHLDTGNMSLGIMNKISQGGGLIAAGAVGGAVASGITNWKRTRADGGNRWAAARSAIAGTTSGAIQGGRQSVGAKNFRDTRGAIDKAQEQTSQAKSDRAKRKERYKSNGQNVFTGHVADFRADMNDYFAGGYDRYAGEKKVISGIVDGIDKVDSGAETLYGRNTSRSKLQQHYLNDYIREVDARRRQYGNQYQQGMQYYDSMGEAVNISNQDEFDDLMTQIDRDLYSMRNYRALSKDAMQAKIDDAKRQGYTGQTTTVTDMYGRERVIYNEDDFYRYMSDLNDQMGTIDRKSRGYMKTAFGAGNMDFLRDMDLLNGSTDEGIAIQAHADFEDVQNIANENRVLISGLQADGRMPATVTYDNMSDIKDQLKVYGAQITAEERKLQREKEARGGNNKN